MPPGAVPVHRPSHWGNYVATAQGIGGQQEAVDAFREWAEAPEQEGYRAEVRAMLRGKDLACWCAPRPCHADVLLEIANS